MPILNYTTKISAAQTVGEIQAILARNGARSVTIDYDDLGMPFALTFLADIDGRWINFRLPANFDGVFNALCDDTTLAKSFKTQEQASRTAWRIVKDWTEAQMAIVRARQAELAQVFLPYAVTPSGRTLFQEVKSGKLLLGDGLEMK